MTKEQIAVKEASARYSVSVANAQGVPPGYRQTEMGVIPDEWEIKTLGQIVNFTNGKAHESEIKDYGKYIVVNSKFISSEGEIRKYSDRCYCPTSIGDILMVMSDVPNGKAIAKCFLVDHEDKYTVNQRICSLRVNGADTKYVFYKLNRNLFYLAFDDGVKQTNLRKDEVLSCPLSIPKSQEEQRTIAAALSDVDALIAALDKLIAKKRAIKTAAMQQLLTGKQHLPGFSGEWEGRTLEELARVNMGQSPSSKNYNLHGVGLPLIQGNADIEDRTSISRVWTTQITKSCEEGDILLTVRAPVGYVGIASMRSCLGRGVCSLKPADVELKYLFHALVYAEPRWKVLEQGSTFTSANSAQISKFTISCPKSKDEQTAIATVLSDMDAEIAVLEARRDKTKALKQGIMQELLTGRIRLV